MTNPQDVNENQNVEATEASYDDVQAAAAAATEEFTSSIGDAVATETEAEAAPAAPLTLDRPIQTVGRRKRAVARVVLTAGSGKIVCNGRELEDYFPNKLHQQDILLPLTLLDREGQFDMKVSVNGGGPTGQSGALRLAIARALNVYNPADRTALKKAGLLTRDARAVERKKAGLHKARRAPQYSKR